MDHNAWRMVVTTFLFAPLLPEYLSPVLTFISFCLFLRSNKAGNVKLSFESTQILMLAFIAWQFIGISWSNDLNSSILFAFFWVFMFVGFLFVSNLVVSDRRLEGALFAATLSGGIAGTVGVGQILLFHFGAYIAKPLKTELNPLWHSLDAALAKFVIYRVIPKNFIELLPRLSPIDINDRANSTFSNPVFFACFLVMVLPLAIYCLFYLKEKHKKWISLVCVVLISGGIASSYSRGPYFAAAITLVILLFMGRKQAIKILAVTPLLLILMPSGVYKRLLTLMSEGDISINTRSAVWDACFEILQKKWLFGLGPGVGNVRHILSVQYGIKQPHAHNIFLQLFLEGGIIGIALFSALIIWVVVELIKLCIRSKEGRPLGVALIASITGLLSCGMTDYVLYGPKVLQYFMMILGLALAAKRIYAENTARKSKLHEKVKLIV